MKRTPKKRSVSIFRRILLPLLIVAVLQASLLYTLLSIGGVYGKIRQNAMDTLMDRTRNRYQIMQTNMNNWSSVQGMADAVGSQVAAVLAARGKTYQDIGTDAELNAAIVEKASGDLIARIRQDDCSGVFFILDGIGVEGKPDSYAGMHLRDTVPGSFSEDNRDIFLLRGLPPISRKLGLALDSFWQACYTFSGDGSVDQDYFFIPLQAGFEYGGQTASQYLGYWSGPINLDPQDAQSVLTYSIPLLSRDGFCYGVVGVEININEILSILNGTDTRNRDFTGCYFLGVTEDGGASYRQVLATGGRFKQNYLKSDIITVTDRPADDFIASGTGSQEIYGAVQPLSLYNRNTLFYDQQWTLIGMQDADSLFAFERQTYGLTLMMMGIMLIIGILVVVITARTIAKPITGIVGDLRQSDPSEELHLRRTAITEIDVLADEVTALHRAAAEEASKISTILDLTGLAVGVYELLDDSELAYGSDGFFTLLDCQPPRGNGNRIPKEQCKIILREKLGVPVPDYSDIYQLGTGAEARYLRCKIHRDARGQIGTIMDVTQEVERRKRMEYDLAYDPLTSLYSRRTFEKKAGDLFARRRDALKIAAVIMIDLDNLKSINDKYGHDFGDAYISTFAQGLRTLQTERCLVGRRSGDEFYAVFYGYDSEEELRAVLHSSWEMVVSQSIDLPDGTSRRIWASGGVAWYPSDGKGLMELIHFADFAMYTCKNTTKGNLVEFSAEGYLNDGYLFNGQGALERLLDNQAIYYALQPVVSARTGEVYGYELLMRSLEPELPVPGAIFKLAKEMGKLYYLEQITWQQGLGAVRRLVDSGDLKPGYRIFINSIANQQISLDDEQQLLSQYEDILGHVVMEVTESEDNNPRYTQQKLAFIRRFGGQVAIDDFGKGYNSDASLVMIDADFVKLDMAFVRGVDRDADRRELILNVVRYAKQRGIRVLAEGVETRSEMETLILLGVDYLQGFYLGYPEVAPLEPSDEVKQEILEAAQRQLPS